MDFEDAMIAELRGLLVCGKLEVVAMKDGEGVLEVPTNTLVIVDEADSLFLDSCCQIRGGGTVVGLTATS